MPKRKDKSTDSAKAPAKPANNEKTETSSTSQTLENVIPIIGIGASAGGLDAFEKFFTHMPPDSGMAFVLVQHLDPTHESMLVDLVKRFTRYARSTNCRWRGHRLKPYLYHPPKSLCGLKWTKSSAVRTCRASRTATGH